MVLKKLLNNSSFVKTSGQITEREFIRNHPLAKGYNFDPTAPFLVGQSKQPKGFLDKIMRASVVEMNYRHIGEKIKQQNQNGQLGQSSHGLKKARGNGTQFRGSGGSNLGSNNLERNVG